MRRISIISVLVFFILLAVGVLWSLRVEDWRIALSAFAIARRIALLFQIARHG